MEKRRINMKLNVPKVDQPPTPEKVSVEVSVVSLHKASKTGVAFPFRIIWMQNLTNSTPNN